MGFNPELKQILIVCSLQYWNIPTTDPPLVLIQSHQDIRHSHYLQGALTHTNTQL